MKLKALFVEEKKEHIAEIAGREYKVGFQKAKSMAMQLGATRFVYDGIPWIFKGGQWMMQA